MVADSLLFLRNNSADLTATETNPTASGAKKGPITLLGTGLPRKGMWVKASTKSQITGTNAVVTIHSTTPPTGGTFAITLGGQKTAALAFNATTATVQAALLALATSTTPVYLNGRNYFALVSGDIVVSGGAISAGDMVFTFGGNLQAQPAFSGFSIDVSLLTGQTATVTQNTTPGMDIAIQLSDNTNAFSTSPTLHLNGATIPGADVVGLIETGMAFYNTVAGKEPAKINYIATVAGTPTVAPVAIWVDDQAGGTN